MTIDRTTDDFSAAVAYLALKNLKHYRRLADIKNSRRQC